MPPLIMFGTISAAVVVSLLILWRGARIAARMGALLAIEMILCGLALAVAALTHNPLLVDCAIAWLIQAGVVIVVITTIGTSV